MVGRYFILELGSQYTIHFSSGNYVKCKFIQTSPKGFNFLNEETSKCIYKRSRCAKGYGGKPIPENENNFSLFFTSETRNIRKH